MKRTFMPMPEEDITKYKNRLKAYAVGGDKEADHLLADMVLCELLKDLGLEDIVREWKKVPKWYA